MNFTPNFWRMTSGFLLIIALGVSLMVLISFLDSRPVNLESVSAGDEFDIELE